MKKANLALLGSVASLLYPAVAMAQTAPAPARTYVADAEEEIIVTARKRDESILKVPVVMTAITQQALEKFSTHDLYTVAARVPGLLVGTSLAANGLQVSMRGIGTVANNATLDNSISLNVDGVQLSQGLAYGIGVFDVAQVEVLKGPQALFFGKNSPAGVISLRSADPTDKFEVIGRAGYEFEAKEKVGELVVSGPVSEALKLRAGVKYSDQSGFFRNVVDVLPGTGSINPTDRRVAPTTDLILRGTALWEPNDTYKARAKFSFEHSDVQGTWPPFQVAYCPDGTGAVAPKNVQFLRGEDCVQDRNVRTAWPDPAAFDTLRNGGKPFNNLKQAIASLEQTANLTDHLTLTSLSSAYKLNQEYLFLASIGAAMSLVSDSGFSANQLTQEVRLNSSYDGPINFTAGAFYQHGTMETRVRLLGNTVLLLPKVSQQNRHHIKIDSGSFFGQINWKITPTLEFAPGARWTTEQRYHQQWNDYIGSGPLGYSQLLDPRIASTNFSPEASLTYTPTSDLTVFANYKTGFKSGSFNGTIFFNPTTTASFNDEKVRGGEVGLKSRLLDHQFAFNAAGYYYRYTNLQVGANEIQGATIINRTLNAASADVYGVDMDATYSPRAIPGLNLNAALNYNHARYVSFPNAPCGNGQTISQGCNQILVGTGAAAHFTSQDLAGKKLVRAPDWMGSVGADYQMPINDNMVIDFGGFLNFTSSFSADLPDLANFDQKGYMKANASITLKQADDRWSFSVIGNNIGNKITAANCTNSNSQNGSFFGGQQQGFAAAGLAGGDEKNCISERGREVWLRFSVKLGS